MTTNRTTLDRPRRASISAEALALFVELERASKRQRRKPEWRSKSKRLAGLLNLSIEFWTGNGVNDAGPPVGPAGGAALEAWKACRQMRVRLLAAARLGRTVCGPDPVEQGTGDLDHVWPPQ
jgi:hypothetical protein